MDGTLQAKVADFGTSRTLGEGSMMLTTFAGTPMWMSPEVLTGEGYTEKADIYSFGLMLLEALTPSPNYLKNFFNPRSSATYARKEKKKKDDEAEAQNPEKGSRPLLMDSNGNGGGVEWTASTRKLGSHNAKRDIGSFGSGPNPKASNCVAGALRFYRCVSECAVAG